MAAYGGSRSVTLLTRYCSRLITGVSHQITRNYADMAFTSASPASEKMKSGSSLPGSHRLDVQTVFKDKFFVSDAKWKDIIEGKLMHDLIVIGSGMCGCAAVKRALEKNPKLRVLMIEGGDIFLPCHYKSLGSVYVYAKGGRSEAFPWTLSEDTSAGKLGTVTKQHGSVPFFGGRSTVWNAWCPRPTEQEMVNWPREIVESLNKYFGEAEIFLNVQSVDNNNYGDVAHNGGITNAYDDQPRYGRLQSAVDKLLSRAEKPMKVWTRVEAARIARASKNTNLNKFSTPPVLFELVVSQKERHKEGTGAEFDIKCSCVVKRIVFDEATGTATGLETSQGYIQLQDAQLIIAAGTLPSTTLVRNSLPSIVQKWPSERFTAQCTTAVTARIPICDELAECQFEVSDHYIPGWTKSGMQFHVQLSGYIDQRPKEHKVNTACHIPSILAKAKPGTFEGHIVFKLVACGLLNHMNENSWFRENAADSDITTNSILQIQSNSATDVETWDTMERALFGIRDIVKNYGNGNIQYMTKTTPDGEEFDWNDAEPSLEERRKNVSVHESSTMYIGEEEDAPVGLDYRLRGTSNVYITGGALWPDGGAWNPVLTMVAMTIDLIDRLVQTNRG